MSKEVPGKPSRLEGDEPKLITKIHRVIWRHRTSMRTYFDGKLPVAR
jgi:hypothetical protein